jgi:hypothetical protein
MTEEIKYELKRANYVGGIIHFSNFMIRIESDLRAEGIV